MTKQNILSYTLAISLAVVCNEAVYPACYIGTMFNIDPEIVVYMPFIFIVWLMVLTYCVNTSDENRPFMLLFLLRFCCVSGTLSIISAIRNVTNLLSVIN